MQIGSWPLYANYTLSAVAVSDSRLDIDVEISSVSTAAEAVGPLGALMLNRTAELAMDFALKFSPGAAEIDRDAASSVEFTGGQASPPSATAQASTGLFALDDLIRDAVDQLLADIYPESSSQLRPLARPRGDAVFRSELARTRFSFADISAGLFRSAVGIVRLVWQGSLAFGRAHVEQKYLVGGGAALADKLVSPSKIFLSYALEPKERVYGRRDLITDICRADLPVYFYFTLTCVCMHVWGYGGRLWYPILVLKCSWPRGTDLG